jgi:hypothetical protein
MKIKLNYINKYSFSTNYKTCDFAKTKLNDKHDLVIPLIVYNNVETEKTSILRDNKGKTGVYR